MSLKVLDETRASVLGALCETMVPGCERIGAPIYVDAILARTPEPARDAMLGAIDSLADVADGGAEALAPRAGTPEFLMVRALAVEAFFSDFVAAGSPGPSAWEEIDFHPPVARNDKKDWSYLGVEA